MQVRRVDDAAEFLAEASSLLLQDEARHNLILGIAGTLLAHPRVYPEFALWLVEESERIVLAALQTPPYNLTLSRPLDERALADLARAIDDEGRVLPGITAATPEVDAFVGEWRQLRRIVTRQRIAQRIYSLSRVLPVAGVGGQPRPATRSDRVLLLDWLTAFVDEALPADAAGRGAEAVVAARLDDGAGGFLVWETDGRPVSLAGWGGRTPNGVRIGPVYTPPEHRRHGYGSAVTAAASAQQLAAGRRFCFLYTDLANPTSNQIYADIGYEPVCDSMDYAFDPV